MTTKANEDYSYVRVLASATVQSSRVYLQACLPRLQRLVVRLRTYAYERVRTRIGAHGHLLDYESTCKPADTDPRSSARIN